MFYRNDIGILEGRFPCSLLSTGKFRKDRVGGEGLSMQVSQGVWMSEAKQRDIWTLRSFGGRASPAVFGGLRGLSGLTSIVRMASGRMASPV